MNVDKRLKEEIIVLKMNVLGWAYKHMKKLLIKRKLKKPLERIHCTRGEGRYADDI